MSLAFLPAPSVQDDRQNHRLAYHWRAFRHARGPTCDLQQTGFWILGITSACSGRSSSSGVLAVRHRPRPRRKQNTSRISAFVGSMLSLGAWWLIRKTARRMSRSQNLETSPKQARRHAGDISPACFAASCSMRFPQVSRTHRTAALGALASEDDCHDLFRRHLHSSVRSILARFAKHSALLFDHYCTLLPRSARHRQAAERLILIAGLFAAGYLFGGSHVETKAALGLGDCGTQHRCSSGARFPKFLRLENHAHGCLLRGTDTFLMLVPTAAWRRLFLASRFIQIPA